MFRKYRKKPIVIEAVRFDTKGSLLYIADKLKEWSRVSVNEPLIDFEVTENGGVELIIKTLEGNSRAKKGDWIIKGINGEFYPCKDDIFKKTYESME